MIVVIVILVMSHGYDDDDDVWCNVGQMAHLERCRNPRRRNDNVKRNEEEEMIDD